MITIPTLHFIDVVPCPPVPGDPAVVHFLTIGIRRDGDVVFAPAGDPVALTVALRRLVKEFVNDPSALAQACGMRANG